ncbi:MAG: AAA family ATPase [Acetobacteraceae bacterium]
MLFADIQDSIELIATYDAEVVREIFLRPLLDRMIDAVRLHGGTLTSVGGDGIMAAFGTPRALEDHAVRACNAGLRMQEVVTRYAQEVHRSHGVELRIRVGIASGEVVGHIVGDDLHTDYNLVGPTTWLASRVEHMARPGAVFMTADTARLVEGYVALKPMGQMPVKGLADAIEIFEATGTGAAQTRLEVSVSRGLTRFVGRDEQLEALRRALEEAHGGDGQVVAIIGEAGVGKSRLTREFLHSPDTEGWLILEASSTAYAHVTPYQPITALLKRYFVLTAIDEKPAIRAKVMERMATLDPALPDDIPPVLDLLDALDGEHPFRALDPLLHRQRTFQAVTQLLLSESRVRPVIVVVEDLHWNDALTLGLLHRLVLAAQSARLLLIFTYRPDYTDDWQSRPNYHQLRLDPLSGDSLAELLQSLLGDHPSTPALKRFLIERASGNPFFVEEIVRTFIDRGVLQGERGQYRLVRPFSDIEVPPTVRAVLAARIDALPAEEKRLLQAAAVIGRDVPLPLLQAICGLADDPLRRLLDTLQGAEFLFATQLFPDRHYTFKHALTHDVAYGGMLRERRREIHAGLVDAMEQLYDERMGEQIERLAHHAVQGALHEKAVRYLCQAGAKAAGRSALADARSCFEEALGALQALPESRAILEQAFDVRLELRRILRQLGEGQRMLERLREALALAERLQDDRRLGQVYALMITVNSSLDDLDEALAAGNRALAIAGRLGDVDLRNYAESQLEQAHFYRGDYPRVLAFASGNLAALPSDWVHERFGAAVLPSVFSRAYLVMSLGELGRFADAAQYLQDAIRLAEASQHVFTIGWAYFAASMLPLLKGDWLGAHTQVERWLATLRTGNVTMHLPWALAASAWELAQRGEAQPALDRLQESEQLLEQQAARGIVGHRGWAYAAAGRACLLLGRLDEASDLGERAVAAARRQPGTTAHAQRLLADIAAHPDQLDADRARHHYGAALALAEQHAMRPLAGHCHLGLGTLHRRIGWDDPARDHLATAATIYRELAMPVSERQHIQV